MQWSHQMKIVRSFLAKMGTHLSNFGYSLTCSSKYTGHQSPFFNMEHPSPVGLRCSWSQFLLEMEVKLDLVSVLSLCFFPDSFKGNPSETAEPIWHCLLQWETRAPVKFRALCSYGQGPRSKNSNLLLHCNTQIHLLSPTHSHSFLSHWFIGTQKSDTYTTQIVLARCTDACRTY